MPSKQEYMAELTAEAAAKIIKAFESLPADKKDWKPLGKGRSAANMIAECALLNGYTKSVLSNRAWPNELGADLWEAMAEQEKDMTAAVATMRRETEELVQVIRAFPDEPLGETISTPFRPMMLSAILEYAQWNMVYHEGQINYIASLLEE